MSPDTFTTRQLLDNFTAKHWACTIGAIAAALTTAAALGSYYGKSESAVQLAELKGELNKVSLQRDMTVAQNNATVENNGKWAAAYKTLETSYQSEIDKNSALSQRIAESSNYDFIHEQIRFTQSKIDGIRDSLASSGQSSYRDMKALEVEALQDRLKGYQAQLAGCR